MCLFFIDRGRRKVKLLKQANHSAPQTKIFSKFQWVFLLSLTFATGKKYRIKPKFLKCDSYIEEKYFFSSQKWFFFFRRRLHYLRRTVCDSKFTGSTYVHFHWKLKWHIIGLHLVYTVKLRDSCWIEWKLWQYNANTTHRNRGIKTRKAEAQILRMLFTIR